MAAHYHRTQRPLLLGDDAANSAVVEQKNSTPMLEQPLVKAGISGAAIYHGYRRTSSIAWALVYGLAARVAPVVTGAVVVAQGFGEKKGT